MSQAQDASCVRAFREHFDFVHRALRRYGAGPADVDDLVQEVFVAMWQRWHAFDQRRPLRPWLAGIAFRKARHQVRRRAREVLEALIEVEDGSRHGEEALAQAYHRALVLRAIARLPERYRLPLILHELDELTVPEMAAILEVPVATAYTRLRRGRLAFASAVAELQAGRFAGLVPVLDPDALLALERHPPRAPEPARRRAEARLRAVMALPATGGEPALSAPRAGPGCWPVVGVSAVAVLALVAMWAAPVTGTDLAAAGRQPGHRGAAPGGQGTDRASWRPTLARVPRLQVIAEAKASAQPPPAAGPIAGLIGRWSFEDDPARAPVRDGSGHDRHCRLQGDRGPNISTDGVAGRALDLGGTAWLECPFSETPAGKPLEVTVSAWVRRRSTRSPAALVTRQLARRFEDQFFFGFGGDGLRVVSHAWSGWAVDPAPPPPGRWFHAAFTHDRDGTTRLYVDGVQVAESHGTPLDTRPVATPITIGAGHFSSKPEQVRQRFDGAIDELAIHDRALTPAQIAGLRAGSLSPQAQELLGQSVGGAEHRPVAGR